MKYFKPSETINEAIKVRDIDTLKALLVGIIGSDPTFATTEFYEAISYIYSSGISSVELEENYILQDDEYKINDKNKWDEHYFKMNLVWLRDNFSLEKRLNHIKNIGKVVYANKNTWGKNKIKQNNLSLTETKKKDSGNISLETVKPDNVNSNYLAKVTIIIALTMLIFLIVYKIFKK